MKYYNCFKDQSGAYFSFEYATRYDARQEYLKDALEVRKYVIIKSIIAFESESSEEALNFLKLKK